MKEKRYTVAGVDLNLTQLSVLLTGELGYTVLGKKQTIVALWSRDLVDPNYYLTDLGKRAVKEWRTR